MAASDNIVLPPVLSVFLESLRDIGYSLQTALADLVDNSISAKASTVSIYALHSVNALAVFDDGSGMSAEMLQEAMRLGTQKGERINTDLGRFGLGLKTASFSQCRRLSVISKTDRVISGYAWDLDNLSVKNEWLLEKVSYEDKRNVLSQLGDLVSVFEKSSHGTLVLWEKMDRYTAEDDFKEELSKAREHLSLTFHRYMTSPGFQSHFVKIFFNGNKLEPFDPFTSRDKTVARSGQQSQPEEHTLSNGTKITITPYILPPLTKLSRAESKELATREGFTRSQGFYLYRQGRLLIYGTWFGLSCIKDASNLVRIKVDVDVFQDAQWKIDVKKSTAFPNLEIRKILSHFVDIPVEKSGRVHASSGYVSKKTQDAYWNEVIVNDTSEFKINENHPRYKALIEELTPEQRQHLKAYLTCLAECYPRERVHALMTTDLYAVKERTVDENVLKDSIEYFKQLGEDKEMTKKILLADEYYANAEDLIDRIWSELYE
jgi:hypothetical protein